MIRGSRRFREAENEDLRREAAAYADEDFGNLPDELKEEMENLVINAVTEGFADSVHDFSLRTGEVIYEMVRNSRWAASYISELTQIGRLSFWLYKRVYLTDREYQKIIMRIFDSIDARSRE